MISPPIVGVVPLAGVRVGRALAHHLVELPSRCSAADDHRPDDERHQQRRHRRARRAERDVAEDVRNDAERTSRSGHEEVVAACRLDAVRAGGPGGEHAARSRSRRTPRDALSRITASDAETRLERGHRSSTSPADDDPCVARPDDGERAGELADAGDDVGAGTRGRRARLACSRAASAVRARAWCRARPRAGGRRRRRSSSVDRRARRAGVGVVGVVDAAVPRRARSTAERIGGCGIARDAARRVGDATRRSSRATASASIALRRLCAPRSGTAHRTPSTSSQPVPSAFSP